jgi:MauM/NapG family ferredoxin protein
MTIFQKILKGVFLGMFLLSLFFLNFPLSEDTFPTFFIALSPLTCLLVFLASHEFLPIFFLGLAVLGVTLLLGRVFCGYICPLGTLFDLLSLRGKKKTLSLDKKLRGIKYFILAFCLAASFLGVLFCQYFEPLCLLARSGVISTFPIIEALFQRLGEFEVKSFSLQIATLFLFLALLGVNFWRKRFWCKYLCPTGALLGIASLFNLSKRKTPENCRECQKCLRVCPMEAISEKAREGVASECIQCRACQKVCPEQGIIFSKGTLKEGIRYLPSKRAFIKALGSGIFLALGVRSSQKVLLEKPLRPPGALPEEVFLKQCVRCGICMRSCPSNIIQPCLWEGGVNALWTPKLVLRLGGCVKECTKCGLVCPTGAIQKFSLQDKIENPLGRAVITKDKCIVWGNTGSCLVCDEVCPYNAIELKELAEGIKPRVSDRKCTGCGVCEAHCPVPGSAIKVVPF